MKAEKTNRVTWKDSQDQKQLEEQNQSEETRKTQKQIQEGHEKQGSNVASDPDKDLLGILICPGGNPS